jgi:preprotein translocase subunit SecG
MIQAFGDSATSNPLNGVYFFLVRLFSLTTVVLSFLHIYAAVCHIVRSPQEYSLPR